MATSPPGAVEEAFREAWPRLVATLVRWTGNLDRAEEAAADAVARALETWPRDGVPDVPAAWLLTTARRRVLDRVRADGTARGKLPLLVRDAEQLQDDPADEVAERLARGEVPDDRLRLLATCCHPALPVGGQVALALRHLCGLTTDEVARAFAVPEATIAQRLVRAKRKISATGIAYREPTRAELPERLPAVLTVVALVFTEGHTATSGSSLIRGTLCDEALRLARLVSTLVPDDPEVLGLLGLLLLTDARRGARLGADGGLMPLEAQDRSRWDAAELEQGLWVVAEALTLAGRQPGRWLLQAAIAGCHVAPQVHWPAVVTLYDQLAAIAPSPLVDLNRAVAVARASGAAEGMRALEGVALPDSHLVAAARGELLAELGRPDEAARAFTTAAALARNDVERKHLQHRAETVQTTA